MIMTLAELADRINSPTWHGHVTEFPFKSRAGQEDPFGPEQRVTLRLNLAEVAADLSKIHQGDRVVVQTESSARAFLAAVAIWARGGVVVPVELGSGQRQLDQVIDAVKASYLYNSRTEKLRKFTAPKVTNGSSYVQNPA
jgi:long-subunit acyl-CoA synthetase (AMP-forming)